MKRLVLAALLFLLAEGYAFAFDETPPGFRDCHLRSVPGCEEGYASPASLPLTLQSLALLAEENRRTNAAIQYEDDSAHYGKDYWISNPKDGRGDCEDYALTKKAALTKAGLPAGALRLAFVWVPGVSQGHLVLFVKTDRDTLLLDSPLKSGDEERADRVIPFLGTSPSPYFLISVQDGSGRWVANPHLRWSLNERNELQAQAR